VCQVPVSKFNVSRRFPPSNLKQVRIQRPLGEPRMMLAATCLWHIQANRLRTQFISPLKLIPQLGKIVTRKTPRLKFSNLFANSWGDPSAGNFAFILHPTLTTAEHVRNVVDNALFYYRRRQDSWWACREGRVHPGSFPQPTSLHWEFFSFKKLRPGVGTHMFDRISTSEELH